MDATRKDMKASFMVVSRCLVLVMRRRRGVVEMFQCGGLKNYARMMERMKDTNRKEDFLPRKYEGVLLCWAVELSFPI